MPLAQRYFIELAYNGTAYHGWQRQPNAMSVQQLLEEAMTVILGERIILHGQGRTDTGVHATRFFAHFDFLEPLPENLVVRMNGYLPEDVSIIQIFKVDAKAHTRFSATSRKYAYHIHSRKDPFAHQWSMRLYKPLDFEAMNQAAAMLLQHQDFACFARSGGGQQTTICTVTEAYWEQNGHQAVFYIRANRFLRNMVRAVVGTLLEIGYGRKPVSWMQELLEHGKRSDAGSSVPACGLYLIDITYPESIYPHEPTH
jgi:tRNA pseudouridine38-40 synthase